MSLDETYNISYVYVCKALDIFISSSSSYARAQSATQYKTWTSAVNPYEVNKSLVIR